PIQPPRVTSTVTGGTCSNCVRIGRVGKDRKDGTNGRVDSDCGLGSISPCGGLNRGLNSPRVNGKLTCLFRRNHQCRNDLEKPTVAGRQRLDGGVRAVLNRRLFAVSPPGAKRKHLPFARSVQNRTRAGCVSAQSPSPASFSFNQIAKELPDRPAS